VNIIPRSASLWLYKGFDSAFRVWRILGGGEKFLKDVCRAGEGKRVKFAKRGW